MQMHPISSKRSDQYTVKEKPVPRFSKVPETVFVWSFLWETCPSKIFRCQFPFAISLVNSIQILGTPLKVNQRYFSIFRLRTPRLHTIFRCSSSLSLPSSCWLFWLLWFLRCFQQFLKCQKQHFKKRSELNIMWNSLQT